jgi:hypothetical protein
LFRIFHTKSNAFLSLSVIFLHLVFDYHRVEFQILSGEICDGLIQTAWGQTADHHPALCANKDRDNIPHRANPSAARAASYADYSTARIFARSVCNGLNAKS